MHPFETPSACTLDNPGRVHFVGIAGAGMSAVAKIMLELGWEVTGSDEGIYPPISDTLERYGIACATPYAAANIPLEASLIVIGKNAKLLPESNAEVAAAFAHPAAVVSFPDILGALTSTRESLVIAGSYGKSTTTALVAWLLESAGKHPGYFIGAAAKNFADYGKIGDAAAPFVSEGDEYPAANWTDRSKFLFYQPRALLLTSAEHDHVNVFPTHDAYLQPFFELAASLPTDGLMVACAEGQATDLVASRTKAPVIWYGIERSDRTDYWAERIVSRDGATEFDLVRKGAVLTRVRTHLLGRAFIQNCVGAAALLVERGLLTPQEIARGVAAFLGVRRRLELRGTNGFAVYEDFGSSYPKCRAGIDTLLEAFPTKKLAVVFDPHTFSFRNRAAISWYDDLFSRCAHVIALTPPSLGSTSHDQLSLQDIVARVAASGTPVTGLADPADLGRTLTQAGIAGEDWVVLVTSSGPIEPLIRSMLEA